MGLLKVAVPIGRLSQTGFGSWHVAPLLDNGLLDLPWVGAGPGADLLGDVNALLSGLQQGHQLGDVLALLLGLQVAGLLGHLGDDSLGPWEALLWARLQLTARWAAKLFGDLLTLSLRRILLDVLLLGLTDLLGPLGTLLLSGVTLSDILALLFLDGLALNNVILDVVLVIPGLALGLVDGPTFLWALSITDEWSVAKFDLLSGSNLPVVDEAVLDEVLLALLFLLGLEVSGVGGVTLLGVAVLALNDIVVLSLLNHHDLVDTPLASSGNGSNVQGNIIATSLTGTTSIKSIVSMGMLMSMVVLVVVFMGGMTRSISISLVERKGSPQVFALPAGTTSRSPGGKKAKQSQTFESVHSSLTLFTSLQVMLTQALLDANCDPM